MMTTAQESTTSPKTRLEEAPAWRRDPYKLFFPLGALLAWAGVFHWLLHALGWLENYQSVVHAIVQIQGFMMCFAVGFLFTAIPRRTGTAAPSAWQMVVGLVAPVATTIAAWLEMLALSQLFWMTLVVMMIIFAVTRFLDSTAGRRPPHSFIWVPLSLVIGVIGSACTAATALGNGYFWIHDLGRLLLLQGMFIGLVVGVGGLALPLITRGESPPDAGSSRKDNLFKLINITAAALLAASCWIEVRGWPQTGLAIRGALVLALLIGVARIYRPPTVPGWHRWLVWLSAWMIPAGYFLAAIFPLQARAGLHFVFIGGFALMAFSVSLHVTLAHGGQKHLVQARPWQVAAFGGCFLLAMTFRALMDFDKERFFVWMGVSAAVFLLGTLFWGIYLSIALWRKSPPADSLVSR